MSDFQYQVGDVVRFTRNGYNDKQRKGMTAIVREISSTGMPIVDSDHNGETLGWSHTVEFVSRPSDKDDEALTIRDQFALAAMTGLLANHEPTPRLNTLEDVQSHYARIAFGYADAMMEARK